MRKTLVVGLLAASRALFAVPVSQGEEPLPPKLLQIANRSKLVYEIGSTPVKKPLSDVACEGTSSGFRAARAGSAKVELVPWEPKPDAKPHFEEAERLFGAKQMDEALQAYDKGLALDPEYGPGWLFSGDVPFGKGDHLEALRRYRQAIALDPTLAQAHRFAAHALERLGRYDEARDEYLEALLYRPGYKEADQALRALALQTDFWVRRVPFVPPAGLVGERAGKNVPVGVAVGKEEEIPGWLTYAMCKAIWRNEDDYRAERLGRREPYRLTLDEELECTKAYFEARVAALPNPPGAGAEEDSSPTSMGGDSFADAPKDLRTLIEIYQTGVLPGYVLVEGLGARCPDIMRTLAPNGIEAARRYLRESVIVRDRGTKSGPPTSTAAPSPATPTVSPPADPSRGLLDAVPSRS